MNVRLIIARRQRVADNNPWKRWLHTRGTDGIVVVSEGLRQKMIKKGFAPDSMSVIYNGMPLNDFAFSLPDMLGLQKFYDIKPDQKIIGVVGRLKRQDLLVKILPDLPAHYRLLFVGIDEKSFNRKYPGLLSQKTTHRMIFTGEVTNRQKLILHYALMHVHVLPSQMDGFGLVSVEAMAMGVPVIGSDYGGIPNVITHGKTGYIFNNHDLVALKNYIIELAENTQIRNQFIHSAARSVIHDFHIDRVVVDYENYFSQLLYSETGHNQ